MASKILAGITHAIVTVPEKDDAHLSKIRATVDLCYGPGDDNAIGQISLLMNDDNELVWDVPHIPRLYHGRRVLVPVFRGQLLLQVCEAAARAVDHLKRDLGAPQFGKRYRVFAGENNKAVEETTT